MTKQIKDSYMYIDEEARAGKTRMPIELVKDITELAKKMGVYRSALLRRVLESFVIYMNDARAFGKLPTFSAPLGVETWMHEREQIYSYTKDINKMRIAIQNEKDVNKKIDLLAEQNELLSNMTNLLNKQVV